MKKFFLFLSVMLGSMCYFSTTVEAENIFTDAIVHAEHFKDAAKVRDCTIDGKKYSLWRATTRDGKVYTYFKDAEGNVVNPFSL